MRFPLRAVLVGVLFAGLLATSMLSAAPKANPAFANVDDNPELPRVLLIGDSISIGYTKGVQKALEGKANVHRIPTNGGPTINGTANIDQWLGDTKWDVIHFNWGLHDLKTIDGAHQVSLDDYEKNLRLLVERMKQTGAQLIWCSTTPVPNENVSPPRKPDDVIKFNEAAARVMNDLGVPTDDLYTFALPKLEEIQQKNNVHFSPAGSQVLGQEVARQIEKHLTPSEGKDDKSAAADAAAKTEEEGFVSLFDGKTLDGWTGAVNGYVATDGVLSSKEAGGGNLYTDKEYGDFHLKFDFRLTPGANNGIGIRAPQGGDAAYSGMEIQVLDDSAEKYARLQPYQYHGSIYGVVPCKRGHQKPVGEWNSEEIICRGKQVTVILNGETIVDADIEKASTPKTIDGKNHPGLAREKGHIALCGHGSKVEFRNFRVKTLD